MIRKNVSYLVTIVVRPTEQTFVKTGNPVTFMFTKDIDLFNLRDKVIIPYVENCFTRYNWWEENDIYDIKLTFEPSHDWEDNADIIM